MPLVLALDLAVSDGFGVSVIVCVGVAVGVCMTVSCVRDISLTDWQMFIKHAQVYHWEMPSSWLDFGDLDPAFFGFVVTLCARYLFNEPADLLQTFMDT